MSEFDRDEIKGTDDDSLKTLSDQLDVIDEYHDVPAKDATADAQMNEVIGKKDDTQVITVGTTKSILAYVKGLISLAYVAGADNTANNYFNLVIGNKEDAAQDTVGTTRSLMSYLKAVLTDTGTTIPGTLDVPTKDATADALMRDVMGKKDDSSDTAVGTTKSIMAYVKGVLSKIIKVPLSDGTVSWNATALGAIQGEAEDALEGENLDHLVMTSLPTDMDTDVHDDSVIGEICAKSALSTWDRTTDSLEALSEAIADLITRTKGLDDIHDDVQTYSLSAKEKSLLGVGVFPGFQDFFNKQANNAPPDTTYWSVVENAGTVDVMNGSDPPEGLICTSGTNTGEDAIAYTKDKLAIGLKEGVTTVHFKARVRMNWASASGDVCGIGLIESVRKPAATTDLIGATYEVASIVVDEGTPTASASDGSITENADVSAYITDNTWFDLEIRITASAVTFYIDGTLRATLSTNVPTTTYQIVVASTNVDNANNEVISVQYVQFWGE